MTAPISQTAIFLYENEHQRHHRLPVCFIYIPFYQQQKKKTIMAQIIDIRPERHQLIFLDELPELNEKSLLQITKHNPMFPHPTI